MSTVTNQGFNLCVDLVLALPWNEQKKFIKKVMDIHSPEMRTKWMISVNEINNPKYKNIQAKIWMRSRFKKNMDIIPIEMAESYIKWAGIRKEMMPKFIVIAQRVKRAVAEANRRAVLKIGIN